MRGCADGEDWVYTGRRVGVELDVENLDRLGPVRKRMQVRGAEDVHPAEW